MTSMPTPNYVLTDVVYVNQGSSDSKHLPIGSFVRPIDSRYVPEHILEDPRYRFFDKTNDIFCYTKYGIVSIPKAYLRQV